MVPAVIDTDVLSEVLKGRQPGSRSAAASYLREHQRLTFSAITIYEIERGLLAKRATRLSAQFNFIVAASEILPITAQVLKGAAILWAQANERGESRNDADLIIAATALESGFALVTGNRRHFEWIAGLRLETWS